ncbi:lipase maturation factor family protein [Nocardioides sp. YIM 152315]|uniref:lipase maturation factor family protein n=1 Tax=Nocardioides sp. YIM 152315 TaxID=3031760 RepID=UPI0023DC6F2D|nr:lipase maturation factor family protein [Nocardioides sp. YIM 152315]MDF1605520.1 lipase maturation factor family protein [Nocardioides sp. YIM 152315]
MTAEVTGFVGGVVSGLEQGAGGHHQPDRHRGHGSRTAAVTRVVGGRAGDALDEQVRHQLAAGAGVTGRDGGVRDGGEGGDAGHDLSHRGEEGQIAHRVRRGSRGHPPLGLRPAATVGDRGRVEPGGELEQLAEQHAVGVGLQRIGVTGDRAVHRGPVLPRKARGLAGDRRGPPLADPTRPERGAGVRELRQHPRQREVPGPAVRGLAARQRHLGGHPVVAGEGRGQPGLGGLGRALEPFQPMDQVDPLGVVGDPGSVQARQAGDQGRTVGYRDRVTDWFVAEQGWLARELFQRALAVVYLVAFVAAARQYRGLLDDHGLTPVRDYLQRVSFRRSPGLFHLHHSDRFFLGVAWTGAALSAATIAGLTDALPLAPAMLVWVVLWLLYLSIVNVGQTWYGFGWESLLLEAGFLAVFLGNDSVGPPLLTLLLLRWLLFRVEFGAGLIKMRGDRCWRDLTCLDFHHETQPMPGPFSWHFHRLPRRVHRVETLANHVTQLVVPFALFLPRPVAGVAAAVMIVTQLWLVASGNFAWLNWLTIVLALSALPDSWLAPLLPGSGAHDGSAPLPFVAVVALVTIGVAVLSYWPVANLLSSRQRMNTSFNRWHLVNAYGAFGHVTRSRYEIVLEGSRDGGTWAEYDFRGKPGDVRRRPRQFAPYHLRLDWLMWFAAISPAYAEPWLPVLAQRLLEGDRDALGLLRTDPFDGEPPRLVRARLYHYEFTTRRERRESGSWWSRLVREFLRATELRGGR